MDSNYFLLLTRYAQDDLRLVFSTGPALVNQYTTELPLLSNLPAAMNVLGSSIFPDGTPGSDFQFFLAGQGTNYYLEYGAQTNTADGFALHLQRFGHRPGPGTRQPEQRLLRPQSHPGPELPELLVGLLLCQLRLGLGP